MQKGALLIGGLPEPRNEGPEYYSWFYLYK